MPTVSSDLRPRDERPVTLSASQPADQATIDAAHAAYLRALRERDAANAQLTCALEHDGGSSVEDADERRTDAAYDLAETAESLLSALGYSLPAAEPATDDDACPHCADEDEDEDDTEGCSCGMADRGAPGHDDHHDAERARVRAELLAVGLPPTRRPAEPRTVWNEHTNGLGDHCPHSGEETDEDPDDDGAACPAGCRSSYPTTDED